MCKNVQLGLLREIIVVKLVLHTYIHLKLTLKSLSLNISKGDYKVLINSCHRIFPTTYGPLTIIDLYFVIFYFVHALTFKGQRQVNINFLSYSMNGILEECKWETLQIRIGGRVIGSHYCTKVCKVKLKFPQMNLSQNQTFQKSTLSGPSDSLCKLRRIERKLLSPDYQGLELPPRFSSLLLNCRTTVYINSLPLCELETNLPRPSPYELL